MKAFFKDNDKLIINSLDHNERLVGEAFIEDYKGGAELVMASRNDINDDFDGLVITLSESTTPDDNPDVTPSEITEDVVNELLDDESSVVTTVVNELIGGDF